MGFVANGLLFFIQIYYFVVFARIILSWFIMGAGVSKTVSDIYRIVYGLTEPLMAPLRKIIPSVKIGMGYLDLSPLILIILLRIVQYLISRYLFI